ncbi:MAG: TolC family protein [Alphaproteobacteria bacterium]|nr:TolC family protein [Alphaproteobacteria bacterium]
MGRGSRFKFILTFVGIGFGLTGCMSADIRPDLTPLAAAVGDRAGGAPPLQEALDLALVEPLLAKPLSMDDAVSVAVLASSDLRATYAELGIAQAELADALRLPVPTVEAVLRPTTHPTQFANLEFNIVQSIVDIFRRSDRRAAAEKTFEAETLRLAAEVVDSVTDVRRAYVEAVATGAMIDARREQAAATDAAVSFAESLHKAGNISDLELSVRRADHQDSLNAVAFAELADADTGPALAQIMGVAGRVPEIPRWLPHPNGADPGIEGLEAAALERRLDVVSHRQAVASARAHLKEVADWGRWPEIHAGASAELEGEGEWAVGPTVGLEFPIADQSRPAVARAVAELTKADHELKSAEGAVRAEVRTAATKVAIARRLVDRLRDVAIPLKRDIVGLTQGEYNFMLVGAFELLDAKREESEAVAEYAEALHEYWMARIELAHAIGGADLGMPMDEEAGS